ncbi:MAG: hypothetical protein P8P48_02850 [Saprospiraceae bacterium]|nr:hypothetical protein [Saprospiraceae bacterium]
MINFTKHNLKKLETVLEELEFSVRYEKGNFNSGFCVVESSKVIVINKFFDTKARILTIIDILNSRTIDTERLSPTNLKTFKTIFTASKEAEEEA